MTVAKMAVEAVEMTPHGLLKMEEGNKSPVSKSSSTDEGKASLVDTYIQSVDGAYD